jgi:protein-S-isoprenylcysteine O-methyltransferase Ste14
MSILVRTFTYAVLFVGLVLVFVPARLLSWSGIAQPKIIGVLQIGGMAFSAIGAVLAMWCLLTFVLEGKGTPAPFDPPRRLVVLGPYRFVRNPMYLGAGFALAGAALFYESFQLLAYSGLFFLAVHLFVVFYEEPRLKRSFGREYTAYCRTVGRWLPKL